LIERFAARRIILDDGRVTGETGPALPAGAAAASSAGPAAAS
jgi:hypothetical protein